MATTKSTKPTPTASASPTPVSAPVVGPVAEIVAVQLGAVLECNTEGCKRTATTRGLCDGHWASRRGDAVNGDASA